MPDGKRHEELRSKGRVLAFPIICTIYYISSKSLYPSNPEIIFFGCIMGYEMGRWVDGDWDLMGTTSGEGRMVNELPGLGHILFGISSMYGSIFRKHHRSFITHFPFVSTSIRHLLLFWWIYWQSYIFNLRLALPFFLGVFVGNSLSDTVHWWADMVKYPKSE